MKWLLRIVTVSALALGFAACASSPDVAPREPHVKSASDIERQLGRRVRVVGEATNTAYGASVTNAGLTIYLDELGKFPASVVGRRVEATGIIRRDNKTSGIVRLANGVPMVYLRDASYEPLGPGPEAAR